MPLEIRPGVTIPDSDLSVSFVRASGPGGQNVNKVASAVQLRFDLAGTAALDERVKLRLRALAGRRVTDDGALLIIARNHRTQENNRREAYERLADLIRRALIEPKSRKPTKPTRAAKERRLSSKVRTGRTKSLRGKVRWDD
ncbi:MAG TPA: alternative ribosome rescue aminoacyl-tRNA hydrolase ArfB [Steroidobacteraceae bacterium]|nr:alternative ribosome rescue aminoacyl-tRNA hydrolase ArfB [Steroidobacteraceae bacterium]